MPSSYNVLIVAGGGGAGGGTGGGISGTGSGGGGAGGVISNTFTLSSNTGVWTITVGSGGTGGGVASAGTKGSNSVITDGTTTYTAVGGGNGGGGGNPGGNGGSGGGGVASVGFGRGIYPGSSYISDTRQGYDGNGGQGTWGAGNSTGGGGGGAGGAGSLGSGNDASVSGGAGIASSITGNSVTYAAGGTGGGTMGGNGSSGTNGLGNGGNGSGGNGSTGGAGGSGIVIISYEGPQTDIGGTTTSFSNASGSYTVHTFTSSGTFTISGNRVAVTNTGVLKTNTRTVDEVTFKNTLDVSYLFVAGGGGGGPSGGAGGGAGGLLANTASLSAGTWNIVIGAGGAGGTTDVGSSGSNTVITNGITTYTAIGGGYGAYSATSPGSGGSGGGSSHDQMAGGLGTAGQGYNGGVAVGTYGRTPLSGGGGGGAGGVGGSGYYIDFGGGYIPGTGGAGVTSSISGSSVTYAQGGTGGRGQYGYGYPWGVGPSGANNTGTGGGGGGGDVGGAGGSGVVVISYPGAQTASGGTVTTSGNNTIHRFTSSGSFTIGSGSVLGTTFKSFSNTIQISNFLDEISINSGSINFNGTNYLTLNPGSSFSFGTGDFTVECWVYPTATPAYQYIIDARNSGQTTNWAFAYGLSGAGADSGKFGFFTGSGQIMESTVSTSTNNWYHLAYSRSGSTGRLFVNGVLVANSADSTNYNVSPTTSYIGVRFSDLGNNKFAGNVTNLRVIKGTALYTTAFTPPLSTILESTANTSLLLQCTNTNSVFVDSSPNGFSITNNGTATFNSNSIYNYSVSGVAVQKLYSDGTMAVKGGLDET